jgi:hypothetical protein
MNSDCSNLQSVKERKTKAGSKKIELHTHSRITESLVILMAICLITLSPYRSFSSTISSMMSREQQQMVAFRKTAVQWLDRKHTFEGEDTNSVPWFSWR